MRKVSGRSSPDFLDRFVGRRSCQNWYAHHRVWDLRRSKVRISHYEPPGWRSDSTHFSGCRQRHQLLSHLQGPDSETLAETTGRPDCHEFSAGEGSKYELAQMSVAVVGVFDILIDLVLWMGPATGQTLRRLGVCWTMVCANPGVQP
ncbi:hypothetical protein N7510_001529 [Penicillium lagena]|uniref:uncharacterized protein n=1 Tax=Penicillium lagena TaxID=94218 RepID=UPI002541AE00|nr:uncharacterized protein N7510_001529 [Penicillium lagena]KAJ5625220.1 hypothetical protein N7510_001529 [Penicillium lagena]